MSAKRISSRRARAPSPRPPARLALLAIPLVGIAAALIVIAGGRSGDAPPPTPAAITPVFAGNPLPAPDAPAIEFTLPSINGAQISLDQYRGRVVFLNFWATWCEPCERELPAFEAFAKAQPEGGAVVLAVNHGETLEPVRLYLEAMGVDGFPVVLDSDTAVGDQYGVFNLPITFIIDQQGRVRENKFGEMRPEDLDAYLAALS